MFIKDLFEGKLNEKVHRQLLRFGKGKFEGRALMSLQLKNKVILKTSFELTNDVILMALSLTKKKIRVRGVILSKQELFSPILQNGKKKGLVFNYEIDAEVDSKQLKEIVEKSYYSLLDIENEIKVKTKKKLPKPKKGKGEIQLDKNFCVLEVPLKYRQEIKKEFFFDIKEEFKRADATHEYQIYEVVLPKNAKTDEELREKSKRKGKIIRKIKVDKKEYKFEKDFFV